MKKRLGITQRIILRTSGLAVTLLLAVFLAGHLWRSTPHDAAREEAHEASSRRSRMPFAFLENRGQWHESARFMARQGNMVAWFEQDAITLQLEKHEAEKKTAGVVTRLTFKGASETVHLEGEKRQPGSRNYFIGNDRQRWQSNVAGYQQILYQGLYAGVDLRVRTHEGRLEYDLLLQPGADLEQVVVQCSGTEGLDIEADGSLVIQTELGPIRQKPPLTWQELPNGERLPIACDYHLLDETSFGFSIPNLDPTLAVVIDPGLEWSTFLGGSGREYDSFFDPLLNGLVVTEGSEVVLVGRTRSLDFPVTSGAFADTNSGDYDIFVCRFNPELTGAEQLIWSTLIGGEGFDKPGGMTIDASGNVLFVGMTGSADFPTTSNAYDTTFNGGDLDAVLLQLDASGSNLLYSSFIGGTEDDKANDLEIGPAGFITITGQTRSPDFPVTSDAFDPSFNGGDDVMVARFDLSQTGTNQLVWSTLVGGAEGEWAQNIAVDSAGSVIVSGTCFSPDFPTTADAFDQTHNGGGDAFIVQLDPGQPGPAQLTYASFLGGGADDYLFAMAVDSSGGITVAGHTTSPDLPVTPGAFDDSYNGGEDVYVSRFDLTATGTAQLTYSTFIGSSANDGANGLALIDSGAVIVVGYTQGSFPTTPNAFDQSYNGGIDIFALRLVPGQVGLTQLEYATVLGGSGNDWAEGVALDDSGKMVIYGVARSEDFPITPGAFQETPNFRDAFVARLAVDPFLPPSDTLFASLDSEQAVPPLNSLGSGRGVFRFDAQTGTLDYEIAVENLLGNITAIHFHIATRRRNGPVVKTIFSDGVITGDTTFTGVWTASDTQPLEASLLSVLFQENIYVNIHTDSFPDGEIRGQLIFDDVANFARALPGVCYATLGNNAGGNTGSLITIDPVTGAGTLVGPTGIGGGVPAVAINSRGEMFAIDIGDNSQLYRIDAATGESSLVGPTGLFFSDAIAFNMNDVLYGISTRNNLYVIDQVIGASTLVGGVFFGIRGMTFDPTDGTLWGGSGGRQSVDDGISVIDIETGLATLVGKTGFGGNTPALVVDADGNLFVSKGGGQRSNDFVMIDKSTGVGTLVGPIGFPAVAGMAMRPPVFEGAHLSIRVHTLALGAVRVDSSKSRSLTINNYGNADLTITAISDPGAPFTLTEFPPLPLVIPPDGFAPFKLTFSPTDTGVATAALVFDSNDMNEPALEKIVTGRGVALAAAVRDVAYATTGIDDGGRLLTIDRETGVGTLVGSTGLGAVPHLAINSKGDIFAIGVRRNNLYRLDAPSGAAILVGPIELFIEAIAFDGNDELFTLTFNNSLGLEQLYKINIETGEHTNVGNLDNLLVPRGMAFDPTDGMLWVSTGGNRFLESDRIYKIDMATLESTLVGLTGLGGGTPDLFFDQAGNLFGIKGGDNEPTSRLIAIDKTTAAGTVIGEVGFQTVSGAAARLDRVTGIEDNETSHASLPKTFALAQNYPNPFNPSTTIRYDLPQSVHVKLVVYDILGRTVRTLVNAEQTAGSKQMVWDGRNDAGLQVATGLYLYRIEAGNFIKARKLMLIK